MEDADAVKLLLEAGADANFQTSMGRTALINTISMGYGGTDVARLLLEAGADANAQTQTGTTALIEAAKMCNPDLVRMLLEARAAVHIQNHSGQTALMAVQTDGHRCETTREILLDAGSVDHSRFGRTPLMVGARDGNLIVVDRLSNARSVDELDIFGRTALFYAVESGDPEVVEALLEAGADADIQDRFGTTVEIAARKSGSPTIVAMIRNATGR